MSVGVTFEVDFSIEASGEPEAILRVSPKIHELEAKLGELGYDFRMVNVRGRRPGTARRMTEFHKEQKKERGA
jgi:hypothetical protein